MALIERPCNSATVPHCSNEKLSLVAMCRIDKNSPGFQWDLNVSKTMFNDIIERNQSRRKVSCTQKFFVCACAYGYTCPDHRKQFRRKFSEPKHDGPWTHANDERLNK